jgi:hypothetical protein
MDAEHVIATLNRLRRAETASLLSRLAESTIFVQPSETAAYAEVQRMIDAERQHLRRLDEVILALDGTVVPGRADIRSADLHYVTLSTTLHRVAQDQRRLMSTYEAAAPEVAESSRAASVVTQIAERHRQQARRIRRHKTRPNSAHEAGLRTLEGDPAKARSSSIRSSPGGAADPLAPPVVNGPYRSCHRVSRVGRSRCQNASQSSTSAFASVSTTAACECNCSFNGWVMVESSTAARCPVRRAMEPSFSSWAHPDTIASTEQPNAIAPTVRFMVSTLGSGRNHFRPRSGSAPILPRTTAEPHSTGGPQRLSNRQTLAPAGSTWSRSGGANPWAEALQEKASLGGQRTVRAATRVNTEQASKCRCGSRPAIKTGKAVVSREASEESTPRSHRGSGGSTHGERFETQQGKPGRVAGRWHGQSTANP